MLQLVLVTLFASLCFGAQNEPSSTSETSTTSTSVKINEDSAFTYRIELTKKYPEYFGRCSSPCQNDGVCRANLNLNGTACLCTPDFVGQTCKEAYAPALTHCAEETCQNGGACQLSSVGVKCLCKPNTTGVRCERRLRFFEFYAPLMRKEKPLTWTDDLQNQSSVAFNALANQTCDLLNLAFLNSQDWQLAQTFYNCSVESFRNGSIWVRVLLAFDMNDTLAMNYSASIVQVALFTGFHFINKVGTPPGSITFGAQKTYDSDKDPGISLVDQCRLGNHDCAPRASCIMLNHSNYVCACPQFTIDASFNGEFPGRRCLYDGLIIFGFFITGLVLSAMIFLVLGCRRTVWRRYHLTQSSGSVTLVNMPSSYEI